MSRSRCLFSEGVASHADGTFKFRNNMTKLNMLPTHMNARVNMSSGRLVTRVEGHGNSSLIITKDNCRVGVSEA